MQIGTMDQSHHPTSLPFRFVYKSLIPFSIPYLFSKGKSVLQKYDIFQPLHRVAGS